MLKKHFSACCHTVLLWPGFATGTGSEGPRRDQRPNQKVEPWPEAQRQTSIRAAQPRGPISHEKNETDLPAIFPGQPQSETTIAVTTKTQQRHQQDSRQNGNGTFDGSVDGRRATGAGGLERPASGGALGALAGGRTAGLISRLRSSHRPIRGRLPFRNHFLAKFLELGVERVPCPAWSQQDVKLPSASPSLPSKSRRDRSTPRRAGA